MANIKKTTSRLLIAALLAASIAPSLTGCFQTEPSEPGKESGVGRYPTPSTSETDAPVDPSAPVETDETTLPETEEPIETDAPETAAPLAPGEVPLLPKASYTVENGKYVYHFEEPNRSAMDYAFLNSMSKAHYPDTAEGSDGSWYFGKVQRNLTTGEVTYVWDRYADTLALLNQYGAIYRRNTDEKVCYLTFDCGYENGVTNSILDTLKEKNVPAMFFVTGQYVDTAGAEIRRMIDEGHIVGNHTEHHYNATTITAETFREEIESVERKMKSLYGYDQPMIYWRPPQGGTNEYVLAMSQRMGLYTVLWSYAYYDYDTANQPEYSSALQKAKEGLHNGCVYLLHAVSETNAAMLGELIDWIRAEGYEIRPLCD